MRRIEIHPIIFGLLLCFTCCAVAPSTRVAQTPVKEKQVDVITTESHPGIIERKPLTVDVREAARNLHNEDLYDKAFGVLLLADNAYLSCSTVSLLTTALNDGSVEVRMRAINLLGVSRNPDAIEVISNRLRNDSSYRVRWAAANKLGMLAGEAAVPALKVALAEDKRIETAVIRGLGDAGGKAVPLLIQMLKDDVKDGGNDADYFMLSLEKTCDKRAIKPLLDIISHPTSPTDPNMNRVRLNAATVLAHFATNWIYERMLKARAKTTAEGYPVTPRENRRVNASDRARIVEALKTAGYDINRLAERFWTIS